MFGPVSLAWGMLLTPGSRTGYGTNYVFLEVLEKFGPVTLTSLHRISLGPISGEYRHYNIAGHQHRATTSQGGMVPYPPFLP